MDSKTLSSIAGLDPSLTGGGSSITQSNEQINKNEFIQLLVTQLQHQDPMEPMGNEEFAVQLAQFSQLEQLVGINEKLAGDQSGDFSSMAAYLGHEVTLESNTINVDGGNGGLVALEMGQDAESVQLELLDSSGAVRETIELGPMSRGRESIELANLGLANGDYQIRAKATSSSGEEFEPKAFLAGVVSGFLPGPEPSLLVGNFEVLLSDIRSVHAV